MFHASVPTADTWVRQLQIIIKGKRLRSRNTFVQVEEEHSTFEREGAEQDTFDRGGGGICTFEGEGHSTLVGEEYNTQRETKLRTTRNTQRGDT